MQQNICPTILFAQPVVKSKKVRKKKCLERQERGQTLQVPKILHILMVSQNKSDLGWIHQKVPQLSEPLLDGQQLSIQAQG